ncbi:5-oxoprolinase subunit PxpB [Paenibacillus dokdonensis]|uniref:5-oxoprolinase subunit PxpB n=1 Tax=Paenibacillus dokdonensis TaxID=2567944 RepID=A0ABU6GSN2_9BACL|nr:5-oxoprolinase subunit PxpB [Paenibacillus dokdonensis]MEC0242428.1 5-oxoprolinase subunit PxpB [Paenibacillus dokdonensis]
MKQLIIEAMGDSALLIQFGENVDEATNSLVQEAASRLEQYPFPGFQECVPSFTTLTVYYDPLHLNQPAGGGTAFEFVRTIVAGLLQDMETIPATERETIQIPVCYGGEYGPDLAYVAEVNGLDEEDVIKIHTGQDFLVYALGFAPGFPYLGGVPESIAAPRKTTPRLRIPAGSVGIAGTQTGIYPLETPGGWQIIGRTPLALFRPDQDPPVLLKSGQMIRFKAVSFSEYTRLAGGRK